MRHGDGSAGDADYGRIGSGYRDYRQPEPEIARAIADALGDAATVLNVGAGAGSYEPIDRRVIAVEPSAAMRAQRPPALAPALNAVAEALPFGDNAVDAAMATFTVHQWANLEKGLEEMRRVTSGPVVILTCDPAHLHRFWLSAYAPEVIAVEARRYPSISRLTAALAGECTVLPVPIPLNCRDGFGEAYYGRPEMLLDPNVRKANSAWSFVSDAVEQGCISRLSEDLASGRWDASYGHLRHQPHFLGSLVLLVAKR